MVAPILYGIGAYAILRLFGKKIIQKVEKLIRDKITLFLQRMKTPQGRLREGAKVVTGATASHVRRKIVRRIKDPDDGSESDYETEELSKVYVNHNGDIKLELDDDEEAIEIGYTFNIETELYAETELGLWKYDKDLEHWREIYAR